uniref:THAP domain-containing protein 1 n=1 Tax=Paramormyrops kingsleyae TaxID=1676925 RepID=A0A3B3QZQ6_9TELE
WPRWPSIFPYCTVSSTYSAGLSFHAFPQDEAQRRRWLVLIWRDHFVVTSHSKVCSRHFLPGDMSEAKSEGGRRRLKRGAVPVLFKWNNFKIPPPRPSVWDPQTKKSHHVSPVKRSCPWTFHITFYIGTLDFN